jgi:hypothetical protein
VSAEHPALDSYCRIATSAPPKVDSGRGLPAVSDQGNGCLQKALGGKRAQGLGYRTFLPLRGNAQSRRTDDVTGSRAGSNPATTSIIYIEDQNGRGAAEQRTPRESAFSRLHNIAGVSQRAILALSPGHWRLSVKRFVLALIKDESGKVMACWSLFGSSSRNAERASTSLSVESSDY